jgi:hypothetical protein
MVLLSALAVAPARAEPTAGPDVHPITKSIIAIPPTTSQLERADYMLLGLGAVAFLLFLVDLTRQE